VKLLYFHLEIAISKTNREIISYRING